MELFTGKDVKESYAAISKEIKAFSGRMTGVDEYVHKIACSAFTHASEHGDNTLCTQLVQAMPKSSRAESLIKWFVKYGQLQWTTGEGESKFKKREKGEYKLEAAYADPFSSEPEVVSQPFDLVKLLKMLEAVGKRAEKGKKDGTLAIDLVGFGRVKATAEKLIADLTPVAVKNDNIIDLVLKQQASG